MKIISGKESEYAAYVAKNQDPYGAAVITFSERWADLMEAAIESGLKVESVANDLSHVADTEGITGFMYGCAVRGLSWFWEHGEQLRRWHNVDTQIGNEGDVANARGGVLNPAVLCIGRETR